MKIVNLLYEDGLIRDQKNLSKMVFQHLTSFIDKPLLRTINLDDSEFSVIFFEINVNFYIKYVTLPAKIQP